MSQFAGPLGGMAIGFSSSLFGVAAAILLNFLQYILSRQQAAFIEDIQDWLKGKLIESQSAEVLNKVSDSNEKIQGGGGVDVGSAGVGSTAFLDIFVDQISALSTSIKVSNQSSELIFKQVVKGLEESNQANKAEVVLFETIATSLKELNINQFSTASTMEDSLEAVSNSILSQHRTIKQLVLLQEENNKSIENLISISKKR
jgi:hypothetical protein